MRVWVRCVRVRAARCVRLRVRCERVRTRVFRVFRMRASQDFMHLLSHRETNMLGDHISMVHVLDCFLQATRAHMQARTKARLLRRFRADSASQTRSRHWHAAGCAVSYPAGDG